MLCGLDQVGLFLVFFFSSVLLLYEHERSRHLGLLNRLWLSHLCTLSAIALVYPLKPATGSRSTASGRPGLEQIALHFHLMHQDKLSGCIAPARLSGAADAVQFCLSSHQNSETCVSSLIIMEKCPSLPYEKLLFSKMQAFLVQTKQGHQMVQSSLLISTWGLKHKHCIISKA